MHISCIHDNSCHVHKIHNTPKAWLTYGFLYEWQCKYWVSLDKVSVLTRGHHYSSVLSGLENTVAK